eukprot:scaffold75869_cov36-Tisochrysis_lutea.AAC.2
MSVIGTRAVLKISVTLLIWAGVSVVGFEQRDITSPYKPHRMRITFATVELTAAFSLSADTGMDDKDLVRLGVSIHGKSFAQQLDERRKARALPEQPPATAAPAAVPSSGPKAAGAMAGDAKAAGEGKGGARGGDGEKMLLNEQSPPPWAAEPEEFAAGCLQPILKEFMVRIGPCALLGFGDEVVLEIAS